MNHPPMMPCIIGILLLSVAGCAGQTHSANGWHCAAADSRCRTVFVVYDAWHAAIVLPAADLSGAGIPEAADLPAARYLEFSWGDQDYFPDPDSGVLLALKAAFWSSGSVVHLVGIDREVRSFYPAARVVELRLSHSAHDRLTVFLAESFQRPGPGQRAKARPGLYSHSRFYPSVREFSLLNTCNTWVARALHAAGLPLTPSGVITAGQLGDQLGKIIPSNSSS